MRSLHLPPVLAALLGVAAAACSTDVGDQICTEESIERDRDDDCPYGPPGGPSVTITGDSFCPDGPEIPAPADIGPECATTHTFGTVFEMFAQPLADGGGNCLDSKCHGVANAGDTPKFPPAMLQRNAADPELSAGPTYDSLQKWGLATYGRPYIRGTDADPSTPGAPEDAWILCNLQGQRGLIMPSPTGFQTGREAAIAKVRAWVNCGMQRTLAVGDGDGGGVGGAGGGGPGAGGAGGEPLGGGGGAGGE